jgi:PHD/YefM family antitoxin component YafN of YafNO toxin-antitoxin module
MLATERTQSLSEFRKNAARTIDRLNKSGDAEIITVNGEARAVLVSPAVYDALAREAEIARDVAMIKLGRQQLAEGKGIEVREAFSKMRAELVAMKRRKTKVAK